MIRTFECIAGGRCVLLCFASADWTSIFTFDTRKCL